MNNAQLKAAFEDVRADVNGLINDTHEMKEQIQQLRRIAGLDSPRARSKKRRSGR